MQVSGASQLVLFNLLYKFFERVSRVLYLVNILSIWMSTWRSKKLHPFILHQFPITLFPVNHLLDINSSNVVIRFCTVV